MLSAVAKSNCVSGSDCSKIRFGNVLCGSACGRAACDERSLNRLRCQQGKFYSSMFNKNLKERH